jgi:hypothetical protein
MAKLSNQNAFYKEVDALRSHQGRAEPAEIAKLALKQGFRPHEALQEIRKFSEYRHTGSTDLTEALAVFCRPYARRRMRD